MLRLRHFTRRLDARGMSNCGPFDGAKRDRSARPPAGCTPLSGYRSLLPSATGRIAHVFLVATRRMPGFEQGMFDRLLRLAGAAPRISLAVHQADAEEFRARTAALGLKARV